MNTLVWILLSTFLISAIALLGIFTLALKEKVLQRILLALVGLSAGGLMGGAFLHLIPEAIEGMEKEQVFIYVLIGFALFFLVEKILHWRHCHDEKCDVHSFAYMNLIGDCVHNFIDGLIIAASFVTSIPLGITTTLAVALHEIPQELGDFGVLVYGGFTKTKALLMNFLVALTAFVGGIIGYILSSKIESMSLFILPFAAGGFIYISASDLIPEIRKEADAVKLFANFGIFVLGIVIMYLLKFLGME